jgi:hypothetical protein
MHNAGTLMMAALAVFTLASCYENAANFALNTAERSEPDSDLAALEQLIARPARRDQAFFANRDFSEKQADYLRARLDQLPTGEKACVKKSLQDSFGERMAACAQSGQWSFLCGGCERISDSIFHDPDAIIQGMKLCGVTFDLPEWE